MTHGVTPWVKKKGDLEGGGSGGAPPKGSSGYPFLGGPLKDFFLKLSLRFHLFGRSVGGTDTEFYGEAEFRHERARN